ncbi:TetR/AcrR family transcriptional regulator [Actinomadura opuntiae]|uniref:TetR/AcrR family transcriptional regulator n=1 Tax=Actinomadura sp. OS1-43 TaxID=604315 RepID=UPI00255A9403|nr:TetR/AcrR family transcriptional regulator [Actinomadura sp. OS1-43]MDL4817897.1 TetR/AcrR family transcriptional regulator [Actinomadura sp. OS1-43]
MRRSAAETREHLLEVAHDLFYWQGIKGVGVDKIAATAGVAPTTLYRLFASKDDLITAYVTRADGLYREWFDATASDEGRPARDRILALFDAQTEQIQPDRCRGCPFLMALAEIPDSAHPAHQAAAGTKRWVRSRFADLASAAGATAPDTVADQLALAFEGAYASVQALGTDGPARHARRLAELILNAASA